MYTKKNIYLQKLSDAYLFSMRPTVLLEGLLIK